MKKGKIYLLLIFSCLLVVNPIFGLESAIIAMFQRFEPVSSIMYISTSPLSFFIQGMILYAMLKCTRSDIQRPNRVILCSYAAIAILIAQFVMMHGLKKNVFLWYFGYLLYDVLGGLITMFTLIINAQQVSQHCVEGYEGFSINIISGSINIAVILSNTLGTNTIGRYLESAHFSSKSIMYTAILCVEIAVIPFLLAFYFLRTRK